MRFTYIYFLLYFFTYLNATTQNLIETISVEKQKIIITPHASFKQDYLTEDFFVMYEDDHIDLTKLSPSITTVPFILSVISMVWHSGKEWRIATLDEDLYHSLKKIKQILKLFYPYEKWNGELIVESLEKNSCTTANNSNNKCAILFSGGVDAICSSFSHFDKQQLLITIGGNDVPLHNKTMWLRVKEQAQHYAQTHNQSNAFIVSNFYSYLKYNNQKLPERMRRFWWALTLQGPSYVGLTAPLLFWYNYQDVYIASTDTVNHPFPLGTHPLIDNNISFFGIKVHHDNPDLTRQNKIQEIKKIANQLKIPLPKLRVCWGKDALGGNCCKCEKCLRTINNILAENELPQNFGFDISLSDAIQASTLFFEKKPEFETGRVEDWLNIQKRIQETSHTLTNIPKELHDYNTWLVSLDMQTFCKYKSVNPKQKKWYEQLWNIGMQGQTDLELLNTISSS